VFCTTARFNVSKGCVFIILIFSACETRKWILFCKLSVLPPNAANDFIWGSVIYSHAAETSEAVLSISNGVGDAKCVEEVEGFVRT